MSASRAEAMVVAPDLVEGARPASAGLMLSELMQRITRSAVQERSIFGNVVMFSPLALKVDVTPATNRVQNLIASPSDALQKSGLNSVGHAVDHSSLSSFCMKM
jgi:hypothetical protein